MWASRRSRFCSDSCSWRSSWSRRSSSSPARVWSTSLRWDPIVPLNSWIPLLSESLGSNFSEDLLFLSFKENPDCFVFHFATWLSFMARTKFVYGSLRSWVCEKWLRWQQTFFMRVTSLSSVRWFFSLLNEQWWRERFSDGLIVEIRVTQVRGLRIYVAGFILEDHRRSLWAVEVVKELGLITCGRSAFCQGARLLGWRRRRGYLPWRCWHWRWNAGQSTGRVWKGRGKRRRETGEGKTRRERQRTLKHTSWMTWRWNEARIQTRWVARLEPCTEYAQYDYVQSAWEKWRVRCICLQTS